MDGEHKEPYHILIIAEAAYFHLFGQIIVMEQLMSREFHLTQAWEVGDIVLQYIHIYTHDMYIYIYIYISITQISWPLLTQ